MKRSHFVAGVLLVTTSFGALADKRGINEADRNIDRFCRIQSDGSAVKFSECKKDNVVAMVALQIISEKSSDADKDVINRCVEMHYVKQGMVNWEDAWECAKRR